MMVLNACGTQPRSVTASSGASVRQPKATAVAPSVSVHLRYQGTASPLTAPPLRDGLVRGLLRWVK
jgi:hypothetical protein